MRHVKENAMVIIKKINYKNNQRQYYLIVYASRKALEGYSNRSTITLISQQILNLKKL